MIKVNFKNLEKSDLARAAVEERFGTLMEKFEDLEFCKINVTLEMENSPLQAGPDVFSVKVHISSGPFRGITVRKERENLYGALADLMDHMLEVLNRHLDKKRKRRRHNWIRRPAYGFGV